MDTFEKTVLALQQSIKDLRPGCDKSTIDRLLNETTSCEMFLRFISDPGLKLVFQDKLATIREALITIGQFAQGTGEQIVGLDPALLKMGPEIGRGPFSVVYKAQLDGTPVAAKVIKSKQEAVLKFYMSS